MQEYNYSVKWSEEDQLFIARVQEFPSLAAHESNPVEAFEEIKKVVKFVLEDIQERGI